MENLAETEWLVMPKDSIMRFVNGEMKKHLGNNFTNLYHVAIMNVNCTEVKM
jgi:hypothetical protein